MRTCTVYVIAAILMPIAVFAQDKGSALGQEDVVRLTLSNQPLIKQAQQNLAAAEARIGVSRAGLGPDIAIAGVYERLDPVSEMSSGGRTTKLYPNDNYDVHLALEHTLYDFGKKRMAVTVAEAARQAVGDNVDQVRLTLAYEAIATCNNILILQNTIAVIDSQLVALEHHAAVGAKKIQAGTATTYDTLTTAVRIAIATNDRTDAVRALNSQMIVLRQLTGLPDSEVITLRGDFTSVSPMPPVDSLMGAAESQRPELIAARDGERLADAQLQLSALGDKPSLALAATSGLKNGYYHDLAEPKLNWSAGVLFRMPLFNGHRNRYEQSAARAGLEAAREHTADVRRKVTADVRQALVNVQSGLSKIATTDIQVKQAELAVRMAATRYEAGVITNVELLDAQTALLQTRLIRLRALYDYTMGLTALDKATGKRLW